MGRTVAARASLADAVGGEELRIGGSRRARAATVGALKDGPRPHGAADFARPASARRPTPRQTRRSRAVPGRFGAPPPGRAVFARRPDAVRLRQICQDPAACANPGQDRLRAAGKLVPRALVSCSRARLQSRPRFWQGTKARPTKPARAEERGAKKEKGGPSGPLKTWNLPRPSLRCSTTPRRSRGAGSGTLGSRRAPTRRSRAAAPALRCAGWSG